MGFNCLICIQEVNHLSKLVKRLSCLVRTYLYSAPWNHNTKNNISFSVSNFFFSYIWWFQLISLIIKIARVDLIAATFTHTRRKCLSEKALETLLSSLLHKNSPRHSMGRGSYLLGKEWIVWQIKKILRACNIERKIQNFKRCWLLNKGRK